MSAPTLDLIGSKVRRVPRVLLESIGPYPVGDTEGMRLYAMSLRSSAELIATAGDGAAAAVHAATFEGPAGDAVRLGAERLRSRSADRAQRLQALADAIANRGVAIDGQRRTWEKLKYDLEHGPHGQGVGLE